MIEERLSYFSLPDTYCGTDIRLILNATGLLSNSMLPVAPLYLVLNAVSVYEHIYKHLGDPINMKGITHVEEMDIME